MGWSESQRGCKKHQQFQYYAADNKQTLISPGVCSACLSEKLSQLYAPSSTYLTDRLQVNGPSSHDQPDFSSSSSSTCNSPPPVAGSRPDHRRRNSSHMNVLGSVSFMIRSSSTTCVPTTGGGGHGPMKKSRSVAVVSKTSHHRFGDHHKNSSGKKKKRGFWSKLLRTTGSRSSKEVLKHSQTSLR
ncbi:hypothetical protein C1H46_006961 [Malus baccata]|uniref:Uncharacterized protein n=1 Tax=Malus baccata TaxID=106549 RepID=A0A540N8T0_MALBA|nr:hypothetical protein C1H46_006961 [Malus baccata]